MSQGRRGLELAALSTLRRWHEASRKEGQSSLLALRQTLFDSRIEWQGVHQSWTIAPGSFLFQSSPDVGASTTRMRMLLGVLALEGVIARIISTPPKG